MIQIYQTECSKCGNLVSWRRDWIGDPICKSCETENVHSQEHKPEIVKKEESEEKENSGP